MNIRNILAQLSDGLLFAIMVIAFGYTANAILYLFIPGTLVESENVEKAWLFIFFVAWIAYPIWVYYRERTKKSS